MFHVLTLVLAGAVLGCLFVLLARTRGRGELAVCAIGLVIAAVIYVAFSFFRAGAPHLPLETLGLVVSSVVAALGVRRWPALVGIGWIVHSGWDIFLHSPAQLYVPAWYPLFCAGFDWVVGIYILAARRSLSPQ